MRLLLSSKYDELQKLIKRHNVRLPETDAHSCECLPVEAFLVIDNELRSIEQLISLPTAAPALRKFVEALPSDACCEPHPRLTSNPNGILSVLLQSTSVDPHRSGAAFPSPQLCDLC
jgi:hypothetical protein